MRAHQLLSGVQIGRSSKIPLHAEGRLIACPPTPLRRACAAARRTELFDYETCIFYTVLTAVPNLDRVALKTKVTNLHAAALATELPADCTVQRVRQLLQRPCLS